MSQNRGIKLILSFLLLAFLATGCGSPRTLTKSDSGGPYSDWEKMPTGSAKYLDGDSVLVSIFLEDRDSLWTGEDRELVRHNLNVANEFLVEEGEKYGKEVNLIYDFEKYPELEYHFTYRKEYCGFNWQDDGSENDKMVEELVDSVYDFIHDEIPIQEIMEKHQVNSIGFLVYVDHEEGAACTYVYSAGTHKYNYTETCFLNLRWQNDGRNVLGSTFAHEILHLFGARDLYVTGEDDNITSDAVSYAYETRPKDIMLGGYRKAVDWENRVSADVTDITAYYLGWKYTADILTKYPDMECSEPASFVKRATGKGNYDSPNLRARLWSQKQFITYVVREVLVVAWILFIFVVSFIRTRRQAKDRAIIEQARAQNFLKNDTYVPFMGGLYSDGDEITDHDSDNRDGTG